MIQIHKAKIEHLKDLVHLFDLYRIFYEQDSDPIAAEAFLKERIENDESVIFIAYEDDLAVGFTQLYPSYSSVSLMPMYVLNDLYVDQNYRKKGVGALLIKQAQQYASDYKMKGLTLETAKDNPAQKLYEKLDWVRDENFYHYFWDARDEKR